MLFSWIGFHSVIFWNCRFFFQGDRGNVLYTGEHEFKSLPLEKKVKVIYDRFCIGDFRLTLEETKRLRPLHCEGRYTIAT